MIQEGQFTLSFIREERHLMMPTVKSILVTQALYDILFQYVISKEKEKNLQAFIDLLESHIKSKTKTPFSLPVSDLEFLEEGLEELKLLNWAEIPVSIFAINSNRDKNLSESDIDDIMIFLENHMTCCKKKDSKLIYVYPANLVKY